MPTYVVRNSASPSAGSGAGVVTISVSSGWTSPDGRRRNRTWRFGKSGTIVKTTERPGNPEANGIFIPMAANEDPEDRIRELERPLAETARASEQGSSQPAGQNYPPGPGGAPPPPPTWTYGGPIPGPPLQHPSS